MHTDRCDNTCGQKCHAKGSRKETTIQEFMYRVTTNVEHEMHDYTVNNWSHQNSNKRIKEKSGSHTEKAFNRFTTKNRQLYWNITHNTESTVVWNLKPEQWGWPLVQVKYQGEKACDKRQQHDDDDDDAYYYYYYYYYHHHHHHHHAAAADDDDDDEVRGSDSHVAADLSLLWGYAVLTWCNFPKDLNLQCYCVYVDWTVSKCLPYLISPQAKQLSHPLYQSLAILTMLNYGIHGKFKLIYLYWGARKKSQGWWGSWYLRLCILCLLLYFSPGSLGIHRKSKNTCCWCRLSLPTFMWL